jgi:hypothetical protein
MKKVFSRESVARSILVSSRVDWDYVGRKERGRLSEEQLNQTGDNKDRPHVSPVTVVAREVKTIDQFGPTYKASIASFQTPHSICGYISLAVAQIVAEKLPQYHVTKREVEHVLEILNNANVMIPAVEKIMDFIQTDRQKYIAEYSHEFTNESEKNRYMEDWVANYEISDWLKRGKCNDKLIIHFFRCVERSPDTCDHEEARRLIEEAPFQHLQFFVEQCSSFGNNNYTNNNDHQHID